MRQSIGAGGRSALVIVLGLLILALGLALWSQNRSYSRLEHLGFAVFDGLGNSVGVATGGGPDPTWLYSLSVPETEVLDFYRRPENYQDWELTSDSSNALLFERGNLKMRLQIGRGNVAFILNESGEAKPSEALESDP